MKGKIKGILLAAYGVLLGFQISAASVAAKAEDGAIDLFTNKNDWVFQQNLGSVRFNDDRELEIIGVGTPAVQGINTAVYTRQKFGSGEDLLRFSDRIRAGRGHGRLSRGQRMAGQLLFRRALFAEYRGEQSHRFGGGPLRHSGRISLYALFRHGGVGAGRRTAKNSSASRCAAINTAARTTIPAGPR